MTGSGPVPGASFGERTGYASWPAGPRVTIAAADLSELLRLSERADRAGLAGKCDQHLTDEGWCRVCTAMTNADQILADVYMQPPLDEDDTPEKVHRFLERGDGPLPETTDNESETT